MSDVSGPRRKKHKTVGAPNSTVRMARRLRKEMSLPEVLLWRELRLRPGGFRFRRQYPEGPYSLDFACLEARLGIEVDGMAHDLGDRPDKHVARDRWLNGQGYAMLRIPAKDVLGDLASVVEMIVARCSGSRPDPPRNGEVAGEARRRGRVGQRAMPDDRFSAQPAPPPLRGPPPRSGEGLS